MGLAGLLGGHPFFMWPFHIVFLRFSSEQAQGHFGCILLYKGKHGASQIQCERGLLKEMNDMWHGSFGSFFGD